MEGQDSTSSYSQETRLNIYPKFKDSVEQIKSLGITLHISSRIALNKLNLGTTLHIGLKYTGHIEQIQGQHCTLGQRSWTICVIFPFVHVFAPLGAI